MCSCAVLRVCEVYWRHAVKCGLLLSPCGDPLFIVYGRVDLGSGRSWARVSSVHSYLLRLLRYGGF